MTRLLIYFLLLGSVLYLLSVWGAKQGQMPGLSAGPKPRHRFRGKSDPREIWMQVYETANADEARVLQARLQEEEVECVVYEQGKKDIAGNVMVGIGVAVPRSAAPHAQNIISRMPS